MLLQFFFLGWSLGCKSEFSALNFLQPCWVGLQSLANRDFLRGQNEPANSSSRRHVRWRKVIWQVLFWACRFKRSDSASLWLYRLLLLRLLVCRKFSTISSILKETTTCHLLLILTRFVLIIIKLLQTFSDAPILSINVTAVKKFIRVPWTICCCFETALRTV